MAIMQKGWFLSKFLMIHLGSYISMQLDFLVRVMSHSDCISIEIQVRLITVEIAKYLNFNLLGGQMRNLEKILSPLPLFMFFEESVVSLSCLFAFKIMHVLQMMISFLAKATKEDQQSMLPTSETSRFVADCNSFCRLC